MGETEAILQALFKEASTAQAAGNEQKAKAVYRQILDHAPKDAQTLQLLAVIAMQTQSWQLAEMYLQEALQIDPEHVEANFNYGVYHENTDNQSAAQEKYERARALDPNYTPALASLGNLLNRQGEHEQAHTLLEKAVDQEPENPLYLFNLAVNAEDRLQEHEAALLYEACLQVDPTYVNAMRNLALLRHHEGDIDTALKMAQDTIRLDPKNAQGWLNLATMMRDYAQFDAYLEAIKQVQNLDANNSDMLASLSETQLLLGDFAQGWPLYARRWDWKQDEVKKQGLGLPRWDGTPDESKTILFWGEQDLSDEIMFASFLSYVEHDQPGSLVQCDERLAGLFQAAFPKLRCFARSEPISDALREASPVAQFPIADLPLIYWDAFQTEPKPIRLTPDSSQVASLREKYLQGSEKRLVGIAWHSDKRQTGYLNNISLDQWLPLLKTSDVQFVSLQAGDHTEDLKAIATQADIKIIQDQSIDSKTQLADYIAQVAAMDLVISNDQPLVHLAGATHTPCWLFTPAVPDWRWGREGEHTHWYPSIKLFRQSKALDWDDVIEKMRSAFAT